MSIMIVMVIVGFWELDVIVWNFVIVFMVFDYM